MRYISILLFAFLTLQLSAKEVSIKGQINNVSYYDSISIVEFTYENSFTQKVAIEKNGSFSFSFELEAPNFFQLILDDDNFAMLVIKPGDKLKVVADARDFRSTIEVEGSKDTDLFQKATKQFAVYAHVRDSIAMVFKKQNEELEEAQTAFAKKYILENKISLSTLLMIDKLDPEMHLDIYSSLDSSLIATYPDNEIVQDFHKDVMRISSQTIGYPIADIVLADADGKEVALSSLKGKVVFIDFWATWCMPCKAEIPNIKNVYRQYKDKGFEVYSVSIDRDKSRWLAEEKKLQWINVHDSENKYAQMFNVQSIPFTILIDQEGRIVAKNVRGEDLKVQVSKLLD